MKLEKHTNQGPQRITLRQRLLSSYGEFKTSNANNKQVNNVLLVVFSQAFVETKDHMFSGRKFQRFGTTKSKAWLPFAFT